jgi:hypothetical protein
MWKNHNVAKWQYGIQLAFIGTHVKPSLCGVPYFEQSPAAVTQPHQFIPLTHPAGSELPALKFYLGSRRAQRNQASHLC